MVTMLPPDECRFEAKKSYKLGSYGHGKPYVVNTPVVNQLRGKFN